MSLTSLVISGDVIFLAGPTSTVPGNIFFVEERGWLFDDPCTIPVGGGFIEKLLGFSPPKNLEKNPPINALIFFQKGRPGDFCHELAQPTNYMVLYQEQTHGVSDSLF